MTRVHFDDGGAYEVACGVEKRARTHASSQMALVTCPNCKDAVAAEQNGILPVAS